MRALIRTTDVSIVSMAGLGLGKAQVDRDAASDPYWHPYDRPAPMTITPLAAEASCPGIPYEIEHDEEPSWPEERYFRGNDFY